MWFFNKLKIIVNSGDGGNGLFISKKVFKKFKKSKGGEGGSVFILSDCKINSLYFFFKKKIFSAENGFNCKNFFKSGQNGKNLILRVPVGTSINFNDNFFLFSTGKEKKLLARGGKGGITSYNNFFKGFKGESKLIKINLKLFSDIILIGKPNTGKSLFFNVISGFLKKTYNYKFSTLLFNISFFYLNFKKKIIIDLPGILKNSYKGFGLGFNFLKHIESSKLILHLNDFSLINFSFFDFIKNLKDVNIEIYKYNKNIFYKNRWFIFNKIDFIFFDYKNIFLKKYLKIIKWYNIFFYISSLKFNGCKYIFKKFFNFI